LVLPHHGREGAEVIFILEGVGAPKITVIRAHWAPCGGRALARFARPQGRGGAQIDQVLGAARVVPSPSLPSRPWTPPLPPAGRNFSGVAKYS